MHWLSHELIDGWVTDFCMVEMSADYLTNWLSEDDFTIIKFRHQIDFSHRPWFASITEGEFCVDYFNDGVYSADSTQINDHYVEMGVRFECLTEVCDCNIVNSFVIEINKGLVAFRRNGVWFTRYN
ncbi:MAG: hypothetical protein IPN76_29505 [Saprospiraceae bacterium]|nr:hypothetical protein [Saprospiraceae bacterium]